MTNSQIDKRLRYFTGQFLQEPDFTDEQAYHCDHLQRHNRALHILGIADGLAVTGANKGATKVTVESGVAIDAEGRAIYLNQKSEELPLVYKNKTILVVISYAEKDQKIKVKDLDPAEANRIAETPNLEVIAEEDWNEQGDDWKDAHIRLTRLHLDADGKIDGPNASGPPQDDSVRTYAGGKLPSEATLRKLSFSRPNDQLGFPELSSSALNLLDLKGDLKVSGKVNTRDLAGDGKKLDDHVAAKGNPHQTTAANIDSQGGTNQIVNQINAGTGTINEARIAPTIVRNSQVAEKLNGVFVAGSLTIPSNGSGVVSVSTQNFTNRLVAIRGWVSTAQNGAPGLPNTLPTPFWSPLPSEYQEGWIINPQTSEKGVGGFFSFGTGDNHITFGVSLGPTGMKFLLNGKAGLVAGYAFQVTWQ